jgi:hypothetical protein
MRACSRCGSELSLVRDENRAGTRRIMGKVTVRVAQRRWRCNVCGEWRPLHGGLNVRKGDE